MSPQDLHEVLMRYVEEAVLTAETHAADVAGSKGKGGVKMDPRVYLDRGAQRGRVFLDEANERTSAIAAAVGALVLAARRGDIAAVQHIAQLASTETLAAATDEDGMDALHHASREGHLDVAVFLLDELMMDPLRADNAGRTAMHHASAGAHEDILVELTESAQMQLADAGLDLDFEQEDAEGRTAAEVAGSAWGGEKPLSPRDIDRLCSLLDPDGAAAAAEQRGKRRGKKGSPRRSGAFGMKLADALEETRDAVGANHNHVDIASFYREYGTAGSNGFLEVKSKQAALRAYHVRWTRTTLRNALRAWHQEAVFVAKGESRTERAEIAEIA